MAAQRHHSGGWRNAARNPTDRKIGDGLTGSIQSAARPLTCANVLAWRPLVPAHHLHRCVGLFSRRRP